MFLTNGCPLLRRSSPPSKGGACSARATNRFARASLGVGRRGTAHAERLAAPSEPSSDSAQAPSPNFPVAGVSSMGLPRLPLAVASVPDF
jgi:hypothetical protein